MSAFAFLECAVLTLLGSYPFAAVMLKEQDAEQYEACGPEGQCTFIRFVASRGLPETSFSALNRSDDVKFKFKNNTAAAANMPFLPTFVTVRNGLGVEAADPPILDFLLKIQAVVNRSQSVFSLYSPWLICSVPMYVFYLYPASLARLANAWSSKEEFPCMQEVDHTYCNSPGARNGIHNHLRAGLSRLASLVCIGMWTLLKIVHDVALLGGVQESQTILIGIVAWCFQAGATIFSMLWAAGAIQVFTSSGTEGKCHACYYQLGEVDMLLVLLTPCLLLWTARSKLKSLKLALVHGPVSIAYAAMAEERRAVPAVMMAIKVLCEASEDDVMNSLEQFRVAHRARLSALMAQSVAEGLEAYKQQGTQASFDAELLVGAVFGNLPEVPGPPSDAAGSTEQVPVQVAHTWGEPVDAGDQAPVSNEDQAPAEAHSESQLRSAPPEFVDELPSELDYAQFNPT
ncbi:Myo9a [Symbiodinium sp. CCMP2456]|nr:Myo9a [Symbiodinium sp. CCMP2456]